MNDVIDFLKLYCKEFYSLWIAWWAGSINIENAMPATLLFCLILILSGLFHSIWWFFLGIIILLGWPAIVFLRDKK